MSDDEILTPLVIERAILCGDAAIRGEPRTPQNIKVFTRAALSAVTPLIEERALRRAAETIRQLKTNLASDDPFRLKREQEAAEFDEQDEVRESCATAILSLIPQEQKNETVG